MREQNEVLLDTSTIIHNITYRQSPTLGKLFGALAKAQLTMGKAKKDSQVKFESEKSKQNYTYADLESVMDACMHSLGENGISVIQTPTGGAVGKMPLLDDKGNPYEELYIGVTVTTILGHESGEWIASDLEMSTTTVSPKGLGAIITYGRRYGLVATAGVASVDDDSNPALQESRGNARAQQSSGSVSTSQRAAPSTPDPMQALYVRIKDYDSGIKTLDELHGELVNQRGKEQGDAAYYTTLERFKAKHKSDLKTHYEMRPVAWALQQEINKGAPRGPVDTIGREVARLQDELVDSFKRLGEDPNKPLNTNDPEELTKMLSKTSTYADSMKVFKQLQADWVKATGDDGGYFSVCKRHGVVDGDTLKALSIEQRGQLVRDLFHTLRQTGEMMRNGEKVNA